MQITLMALVRTEDELKAKLDPEMKFLMNSEKDGVFG